MLVLVSVGKVSIPFIAGQWSLRFRSQYLFKFLSKVSIPFIAGQWSLHFGGWYRSFGDYVSIPFIAGQWSLHGDAEALVKRLRHVSIPFIAGQWSLRSGLICGKAMALFQSPSLRGSGRFRTVGVYQVVFWGVSIPFIAGQWSLLYCILSLVGVSLMFQSPSLRGSGRFEDTINSGTFYEAIQFQSPSLRGSGRFPKWNWSQCSLDTCFNPLHCGAVVASLCFNG